MTKKGETGQKLDKGESLYTPGLALQIVQIILEMQPLKGNGQLHYRKIATVVNIPLRTFNRWRNPESQYYKPGLVEKMNKAHEELVEKIEAGKIKGAMIKRAQPYTRVKKFKELQTVGPDMPAMSSLDKKALHLLAVKFNVKFDKSTTNGVLKIKIQQAVLEQRSEKMVTVRQEEERMHGDVNAAKFVLPHIGPVEKRWIPQEKLEVEGKSLADIAAIMSGKRKAS